VLTRDIRRYVSRDWKAARDAKDAYWADRIGRLGPIEGLRIADELRRQVIRLHPGWPDVEDRRRDLADHIKLAERLRRVPYPRRG
jgi:hypothetical protein